MEKGGKGYEKKVMVVIDESENSYQSLIWFLENLKELITNSSVIIFATQPLPNYNHASISPQLGSAALLYPFGSNQELIMAIQKRTRRISECLCQKAKIICATRGVFVEAITEAGEPKEVICNAVYKHEIDLLVLPNLYNSPFKRIFVESLSDYCMRNAKCPIIVVQNPAGQKSEGNLYMTTNKFV